MKSLGERFFIGALAPVEGLRDLLSDRKTLTLALVPFAIGLVMVGLLFVTTFGWLQPWILGLTEGFPQWGDTLFLKEITGGILFLITFVLLAISNILLGYLIILLFAGPFYSIMVEHRFKLAGALKVDRNNFRLILSMFFLAILKFLLFSVVGIICFLMAFIPGLNIPAAFIVFLMIAFDCSDFAFEIDYLTIRERLQFIFKYLPEYCGLSFAIFLTSFVPGSFFLLLPSFICGATKIYIQRRPSSV